MTHEFNPRILILTTLALGACFDPMVNPVDTRGPDSGTDGSSTDPGTTTADTDSAEGIADSTGAVDSPPEIQAFTVNGSTAPSEQQVAGMIAFDVDAMDDVGIDHVEIYDGDELIAMADSSPYVVEVLVSSADNGSHEYTAVAVDTVGQTDESEVVQLSVNVVGGALLQLREDVGEVQVVLGFGGPKIAMLPGDDILVTGMARLTSVPELRTGLLVRGYNDELSLLWSHEHMPAVGSMGTDYSGFSTPSVGASGSSAYVGGSTRLPANTYGLSVFSLDAQTGTLTNIEELWTTSGGARYVPVATIPRGDVLATAAFAEIARYSDDFTTEHWRASPLGVGVIELASTSQGEAIALYAGNDCATGAGICLAKLTSSGDILWTRAVAPDTAAGLPTRPTVSSSGNITVVRQATDGTTVVLVLDDQGNELASTVLDTTDIYPYGATYTPDDDVVIVGHSEVFDSQIGWARRMEENGDVLWDETYEIGATDSTITGVAISSIGRLYLSGTSDPFDPDFLTNGAHAWIAEIAL